MTLKTCFLYLVPQNSEAKMKQENENLLVIFNVNGKKQVYDGINAVVFNTLFMKPNWIYSVQYERNVFETQDLKIVFIDVKAESDLGLK